MAGSVEPTPEDLLDLHWYNIPNLESKSITRDSHFFQRLQSKTGLGKHAPVFVYLYNGRINFLEDLKHDDQCLDKLNDLGLSIFLFEPLCYRPSDFDRHNQQWYSEFEPRKDLVLLCDEFESIKIYVINNGIKNLTVYTCDFNCEKYFENYRSYFDIRYYDLFVRSIGKISVSVEDVSLEKKFICLNWRYTKHRHMMVSYLADKSAMISWYFKHSEGDLENNLWFPLENWNEYDKNLFKSMLDNQPILNNKAFVLDLDGVETVDLKKNDHEINVWPSKNMLSPFQAKSNGKDLSYFFSRAFVSIVNETRFAQPTGNFSEKTLQAVDHSRPFIILSGPMTLACLKTYGFETFSEYWDESYDTELSHVKRLSKILRLIDYINSLEFIELNKMLISMKKKLMYNKEVLDEIRNKGE